MSVVKKSHFVTQNDDLLSDMWQTYSMAIRYIWRGENHITWHKSYECMNECLVCPLHAK